MEFEEGGMLDERKAYYANNREALNEAVEKIRTDAAETTQKYGEMSGKLHLLNALKTKSLTNWFNLIYCKRD